MARLNDGSTIRKGGFGWRLGDEGSAWYIADQAVKRALKSTENREIKSLLPNKIVEPLLPDMVPAFSKYLDNLGDTLLEKKESGSATIIR